LNLIKKKKEIFFLNKLVFKRKKTSHLSLFKIMGHGRYLELSTFVSQKIKTLIQENHLTGLQFSEHSEDEGGNLIRESPEVKNHYEEVTQSPPLS